MYINYDMGVTSARKPNFDDHPCLATAVKICNRLCDVAEEKAYEATFEVLVHVTP
jgi:hypothetical protein